ncbi:PLC-like phosphodiesterase [Phlegmacium glaucopus]|nr:PLC-like phosphodiesterase [Phlegmacium glaucopus]
MSFSLRLAALTSLLFISQVFGLAIPQLDKRDQLCNGHAGLCDRSYGNVTFLGAHDSFADSYNPFALARTQEFDVAAQLTMGVRLLQAQAHMNAKDLHFCHTTCGLFDGGKVEDYFKKVEHFLDRHPNEVLTIILANPEEVSTDVWEPIFESTGLASMAYVPPQTPMARGDWPTLKEMLDAGTRVVIFMDKGADDGSVNYILPQFSMMWEDEYDPTNPKFPCKVDRTEGPLEPAEQLSLINHNLNTNIIPIGRGVRIPDRLDSPRTNSVHSITAHARHCAPLANDNKPNFVLLDFVNIGQASMAVAHLNGFPY